MRLRHRILRGFYDFGQVLRILRKAVHVGLVTPRVLARVPGFLAGEALRSRRR
jgi:hypothetical protein